MTAQQPIPGPALSALKQAAGEAQMLTDPAACWPYGYDNSRHHCAPQAVVFACSHEQVQAIVAVCRKHHIPLVARGRGTNTTGASVPLGGGVVISFERMNQIVEINPGDRLAVVQPGVLNADLQRELAKLGFFWAPDPSSAAYCSVGGNLACNAAGPRAVKYGTPRDNTLGLRAVAGDGTPLRTGVRTSKGVVGFDLTRLLIGSEGQLALITEATLKILPLASGVRTLKATYASVPAAANAVSRVMSQGVIPCALEFMDQAAVALARNPGGAEIEADAQAMLMLEVDGQADALDASAQALQKALAGDGLLGLVTASNDQDRKSLWQARKALSPALREIAPGKINEDVAVPVSRLADLVAGVHQLGQQHSTKIVSFGHAGNGNLHVNLLFDNSDEQQSRRAQECLQGLFDLVLGLGGTLSGEHGVGIDKAPFVSREIDPSTLDMMARLKCLFDPDGILNPGK